MHSKRLGELFFRIAALCILVAAAPGSGQVTGAFGCFSFSHIGNDFWSALFREPIPIHFLHAIFYHY